MSTFERLFGGRRTETNDKADARTLAYQELGAQHLNLRRSLMRVALSTFVASALVHKPQMTEAAEVTQSMTWQEGTAAMRKDVYRADHEVRGTYVQFKDGKSTWIVIGDGPKVGTDPNPLVLGDSGMSEQAITEQQKELLAPDMEKGNVAVICNIHTHPVSAIGLLEDYKVAAQEAQQSGTSTLLLPPSMDDIGISGYDRIFPQVRYETAVEDPSGIWYHRPATVNDLAVRPGILDAYRKYVHVANSFWDYHAGTIKPNISKLSETDLDELLRQLPDYFQQSASKYDSDGDDTVKRGARETALSNAITTVQADERISERFITDAKGKELYKQWKEVVVDGDLNKYNRVILAAKALMTDSRGTIPSPESLQEIIDAYLANGDKVRFVTYEEAKSEPPCAGVDYSSSKRK